MKLSHLWSIGLVLMVEHQTKTDCYYFAITLLLLLFGDTTDMFSFISQNSFGVVDQGPGHELDNRDQPRHPMDAPKTSLT